MLYSIAHPASSIAHVQRLTRCISYGVLHPPWHGHSQRLSHAVVHLLCISHKVAIIHPLFILHGLTFFHCVPLTHERRCVFLQQPAAVRLWHRVQWLWLDHQHAQHR